MIFRKIAFVLVILFFAAIAVILVTDLVHTEKKIDKQKKIKTKTNTKAKSKKTYYH